MSIKELTQKNIIPIQPDLAFQSQSSDPKQGEDLASWLRFNRDRRWSRRQKVALLQHFEGINGAYAVSHREAVEVFNANGINPRRRAVASNIDESMVDQELTWLRHDKHHFLSYFDSRYPELLKHINDPPLGLFVAGDLGLLAKPKVAIVGSRRPSLAGVNVASEIASGLAALDVAVVSGLALGIDGVAHKAALGVNGPTIAIVGTGIDVIYPRRHTKLFWEVMAEGLVISEYPFGLAPSRYTFPDRNRLVSGLCSGVVIVEAAEKSGTLITARLAMEQDRELMVVPGAALSDQYQGSHRLIKDGAALVCNATDVLAQLSKELEEYCNQSSSAIVTPDKKAELGGVSSQQAVVMAVLEFEALPVDVIVSRSGLCSAEVSSILLSLELAGMVASSLEGGYIRTA